MVKNEAELKYNKSTLFLYPLVYTNQEELITNGFINVYIGDHEYDIQWNTEYCLYLLFKPKSFKVFEYFADKLRNTSAYRDEYDIDGGYIMVVLQVPEKFHCVLDLFKQAKYSEFPEEYWKKSFRRVIGNKTAKLWKVFTRDKTLREEIESYFRVTLSEEDELYEKPYPKDEIYRFSPDIKLDWS